MIALDTSVLVAIALREIDYVFYRRMIARHACIVGAATLFELHAVLRGKGTLDPIPFTDEMVQAAKLEIVPTTSRHFLVSREAFDRYGKGRGHKASLNFGDCLAYAVAKVANVPLLFKGDDFLHTDIQPAYQP